MATYIQYADQSEQILGEHPSGLYVGARMHTNYAVFTQTAATIAEAILEMELPRLLPGKVIVHPYLCWLHADDAGAGAELHIGYREYTNSAGELVAADDNYWMDNAAVGAGDLQGLWPAVSGVTTLGAQPAVFDAQDGLRIVVMVDTGAFDVADTVTVVVVYSHID